MGDQQQFLTSQPQILRLPGFGKLLKRTWQVYKVRLGAFLGILILPVAVNFFLDLLIPEIWSRGPLFALSFIISFLLVILLFWAEVSLLYAIKEREAKIGVKESFKKGWLKIIPFVWISLLAGLITLGGFFLLIIPGIIFAVWFVLSTYVLVSEDLRGMNALLRSKQLVKENWWGVFWRFLAIGSIGIVIDLIISAIAQFLSPLLGNIINSIFNLFFIPFALTFGFLIYENLKHQKEGIAFELPKRKTKLSFILIGIVGILLISAILILSRLRYILSILLF